MKGLFIGRFQPLHLGHLSIMESALEEVDRLIIGIGSAECSYTPGDPFTGGERMEMILDIARERGWEGRLIPVPVRDVNRFSIWVSHVVSLCPDFEVVYSNNPLTISLFTEAGYEVRTTKLVDRSVFSGSGIRGKMAGGEDWKHLVPPPVSSFLDRIEGVKRVRSLSKGDGL